jgi:hypothetical protein
VERFERDQHNHVIRQFFHIKQSGSVVEYIELFDELVHKILAHDPYFNPAVITSRFVDGLRREIKAVVLVHRPKDLDTASSLVILQEEVLLGYSGKEAKKQEFFNPVRYPSRKNGDSFTKAIASPTQEDERLTSTVKNTSSNDKLAALMAYWKAKGLCYKCGLKWGSQHHCPDSVALNVVEELWQMVSEQDSHLGSSPEGADSDSIDDLMAISTPAVNGTYGGKTIKLKGHIQHHKAIFLIDSGSSHTFVSEQLASSLSNWKCLDKPITVKVAYGRILQCTHEIENCDWVTQGVQFQNSFKVLPLKCYDAILGMD